MRRSYFCNSYRILKSRPQRTVLSSSVGVLQWSCQRPSDRRARTKPGWFQQVVLLLTNPQSERRLLSAAKKESEVEERYLPTTVAASGTGLHPARRLNRRSLRRDPPISGRASRNINYVLSLGSKKLTKRLKAGRAKGKSASTIGLRLLARPPMQFIQERLVTNIQTLRRLPSIPIHFIQGAENQLFLHSLRGVG